MHERHGHVTAATATTAVTATIATSATTTATTAAYVTTTAAAAGWGGRNDHAAGGVIPCKPASSLTNRKDLAETYRPIDVSH